MKEQKKIYDAKCDQIMKDSYIDADEPRERVLSDGRVLPVSFSLPRFG